MVVGYVIFVIALPYLVDLKIYPDRLVWFIGILAASIILLIIICWKKGEPPRWQWGDDDTSLPK